MSPLPLTLTHGFVSAWLGQGTVVELLEAVPELRNLQYLALRNQNLMNVLNTPVEINVLSQQRKVGQVSPLWLSVPNDFDDAYTMFHIAIATKSKSGVSKLLKAVSNAIDSHDFYIAHAVRLLKDLKTLEDIVAYTKIILSSGFDVGRPVPFGRRLPRWQFLLCICPTVEMFKLLFEWELQIVHGCSVSAITATIGRHAFLPSVESLTALLCKVAKPSPVRLPCFLCGPEILNVI
jgi:hypothetical protein